MTSEQRKIVDAVIERAEQACRYAFKHQNFTRDENPEYVSGWEAAAEVCESAIRRHVEYHIEEDLK